MISLEDELLMESRSFFLRLSSEENYSEFIQKKIEKFDENYKLISEEEARKSFFDIIHNFMIFGSEHDLSILKPIDFIKRYEFLIPEDKLIDVYFSLNNYDCALEFIKLKKEELRKCFRKYYITFYEYDSLCDFPITEVEYQLLVNRNYKEDAFKKKVYTVAGNYKEKELKILLYRYFRDDVDFIFYNEEKNKIPLYGFCSNIDWKAIEEIFVDLYEKGEYEKMRIIIKKTLSHRDLVNFTHHFENKHPFNNYQFYGLIFLELIPRFDYHGYLNEYILLMKEQEKFIIDNIEPNAIPCTNVLSNEFFANLKYLKTIPKREVRNHPLYAEVFEVYLSFCRSFYSFNVDEYIYVFRRLFNRLIEGQSLLDSVQIKTIESLFHFYKTNEIVQFNNPPKDILDTINSYITKQYFELKQLLIDLDKNRFENFILFTLDDDYAASAIYLMSFFGFENSKKILKQGISAYSLIKIAKLAYKDKEEKLLFLNIILKDTTTFFKESNDNLNLIFKIFRHLKEEKYPNITMKKIVQRIKSFEYALLPNVECIKDNLLLLDLVSKGEPIDNKIEGIKLYNDYRLREHSSIPDVSGYYQNLKYETVDMHSHEIISNGIGSYLYPNNQVGSSCLTPAGKAASCLFHGAINPHGRFFKVTLNDKIVAYSWIWRAGDVLCFDNIEITDEALKIPYYENVIMNLYSKATKDFIKISASEEERPLKVVVCGRNKIDMLNKPFDQLKKVTDYHVDNFKPNNSDKIYLDDSKDTQYVLYGDLTKNIDTTDTNHFHVYKRKNITRFVDWPEEQLPKLINSIYFDYCLFTNKKYKPLQNKYVDGFIGEDWVIGYKEDGSYDLFYQTINESVSKEISEYLSINVDAIVRKPHIITHNYEGLDYLLNQENYEINRSVLKDYLNSVREKFTSVTSEDYYHTPRSLDDLGHIVYDGAITSSAFGHHDGGGGNNGSHFISVASLSSGLFENLSHREGFILDQNLCAFQTGFEVQRNISADYFRDSRYPIRLGGGEGELQVLDYIELSKAKGVLINTHNEENIARIFYILESKGIDLPLLIDNKNFYRVDKNELKYLIKLK